MTSFALDQDIDPTGLGGDRVHHAVNGEHITELWAYSARYSLEAIRAAWVQAYPRERHFTGVVEYKVSAGRRFVHVDRYMKTPIAKLRIDEPDI